MFPVITNKEYFTTVNTLFRVRKVVLTVEECCLFAMEKMCRWAYHEGEKGAWIDINTRSYIPNSERSTT